MTPLPQIAVGGAPPPRLPGGVFPKKKKMICISVKANHIIQFQSKFVQKMKIALQALQNQKESYFGQNYIESKWLDQLLYLKEWKPKHESSDRFDILVRQNSLILQMSTGKLYSVKIGPTVTFL